MILDTQEEVLSFVAGVFFTLYLVEMHDIITTCKTIYNYNSTPFTAPLTSPNNFKTFAEIPPVAGYQSDTKFEGWMNEYPETYDPQTYQISETQSVYVQLQGHSLTINHVRGEIPKHSMWNEEKLKLDISHNRIYNLLDAKIMLLPEGLNKKRYWNKKYPICLVLNKDQTIKKIKKISLKSTALSSSSITTEKRFSIRKQKLPESKKKKIEEKVNKDLTAIFGKYYLDRDITDGMKSLGEETRYIWDESTHQTRLYLFARNNREKEDWFRRFTTATYREADTLKDRNNNDLNNVEKNKREYLKYMAQFDKIQSNTNVLWVNVLLGRILFDYMRDENTIKLLVEVYIKKKLNSFKLPSFIEQLLVTKLSLGNSLPIIRKVNQPILDQRGLWIDLDILYDGTIALDLLIKLNLLKFKKPTANEILALEDTNFSTEWLNSDIVDDTSDNSADEEREIFAGSKFVTFVDKIVESKFFRGATKYRSIKKVVEGVSNTELSLTVEVKELIGTLVLNIPPPPSDRIWYGFRPTEKLHLSAQPVVGKRSFGFLSKLTTRIIKERLSEEFQKVWVTPNMENILIPTMMSQKLPE